MTDLTWRIPIIILHWFSSYIIIPRASSVNPFPWVGSLIMAQFHQYFTVLTTWDNNLIASQRQRERCLKRPLEIDVYSFVEMYTTNVGEFLLEAVDQSWVEEQRDLHPSPHTRSFLENTGHCI